ncbi:unnamed protein product [Fraxinus pennsylvanica]|uniref:Uncharacterized protein n=1 Tax=Fraxinus pennsylvanica TaxID=56036 RepID=A0AAD2ABJ3_9LAMI|nr:unnamed protein product [Fraxinus pennsylvanica]
MESIVSNSVTDGGAAEIFASDDKEKAGSNPRNGFVSMEGTRLLKNLQPKIVSGDFGYILEYVPHFSDYIPHLPVRIISNLGFVAYDQIFDSVTKTWIGCLILLTFTCFEWEKNVKNF